MLTYLIPFIVVLAGVQATYFPSTIIVDIMTTDSTDMYTYQDITLYDSPSHKTGLSSIDDGLPGVGRLLFTQSNDVRAFRWKKDEDGMEHKQCSIWLDEYPGTGQFTYNLNTGKSSNFYRDGTEIKEQEAKALKVSCDGDPEPRPVPPSAPRIDKSITEPESTPSSPTPPPGLPSGLSTLPAFKETLDFKFFANPNSLRGEPWFLDITPLDAYKEETDKPTNGLKPDDLDDSSKSKGVGQITMTHPSTRHFGWQRLLKYSNDVNIDDCWFSIIDDLEVDEVYYWLDTKKVEARKDGKAVEEAENKEIEEKIVQKCYDKDGTPLA